jgi:predicted signal transduction protein with EAL and GGDEF domain
MKVWSQASVPLAVDQGLRAPTPTGALAAVIETRVERASSALIIRVRIEKLPDAIRSLGATVGETVLRRVIERVRELSAEGVVAQISESDFALCVDAAPEEARTVITKADKLLSGAYLVNGHVLELPAFLGCAIAPRDGESTKVLLHRAEIALRAAIQDRAQRALLFEPALENAERDTLAFQNALRGALLMGEFELFYQPQCDIGTGAITGFESLLRWRRPVHGLVSPGSFIPALESSGLIVRVGEWAIRQGCAEAARWPAPLTVAINVSPIQLASPALTTTVLSALASSGLAPHRLELEVTESCLMADADAALATLRQLRAQGVRLSLDDFGTGYSSLSYLKKFPFTKIKIDQSFVREAEADDAILKAIVDIGRSLGMTTIAEGVETADQLKIVAKAGCAAIQGYLVSRPVEASAVSALLAREPKSNKEASK